MVDKRQAVTPRLTALVADHYAWTRSVINDWVPGSGRATLNAELDRIAARAMDPNLYLAFYGEFSSGKSTLINALLGTPLLPTSALVTTQVLTYLRTGEATRLRVRRAASGRWATLGERSFAGIARDHGLRNSRTQLQAALHGLIADPVAVDAFSEVEVTMPQAVLGPDVVVIDTPGINSLDERHQDLARTASGRADLAVVVVPANIPVSLTLAEFVTTVLPYATGRVVFVLTKGRLFGEDERAELLRFVSGRLIQQGVPDPVVLAVSAADLVVRGGDTPVNATAVAEVVQLQADLTRIAAGRREDAVEASLRNLLGDLLDSVGNSLSAEVGRLESAERELGSVRITALPTFLESRVAVAEKAIHDAVLSGVQRPIDLGREVVWTTAVRKIAAANAGEDFKALAVQLPELIESTMGKRAEQLIQRRHDAGLGAARDALGQLRSEFAAEYERLSRLAGKLHDDRAAPKLDLATERTSWTGASATAGARTVAGDLLRTENLLMGAGVGAGAIIGTIIFPGVGTIIGGFLGAMFGTVTSGRRAKMTEAVRDALDRAQQELETVVESRLSSTATSLQQDLRRAVREFGKQVGPAVDALAAKEVARRRQLRAVIAELHSTVGEAVERHDGLVGSSA